MAPGDSPILVAGGTGKLGRPTVALLRDAGHEVRVLSRRPGDGRLVGDLDTGDGLADAVRGAGTLLHLTQGWTREADQTRRIVDAARNAGVRHLVYISIVGVDRSPFPYHRAKLESERVVEESGIPWTILRATQFHDFVADLVKGQLGSPLAFLPPMRFQPIAIEEVAARLVELAGGEPTGRAADIAGPEQLPLAELARIWYAAHGKPWKRIVTVPLPGKAMKAFRDGVTLGTLPGYGTVTFADFAAR